MAAIDLYDDNEERQGKNKAHFDDHRKAGTPGRLLCLRECVCCVYIFLVLCGLVCLFLSFQAKRNGERINRNSNRFPGKSPGLPPQSFTITVCVRFSQVCFPSFPIPHPGGCLGGRFAFDLLSFRCSFRAKENANGRRGKVDDHKDTCCTHTHTQQRDTHTGDTYHATPPSDKLEIGVERSRYFISFSYRDKDGALHL